MITPNRMQPGSETANTYALATQHLQAAINLRRANDYLENVFENSPDAIGIVDENGKFIKWNKMAAELFGYAFEDLKDLRAFDLYADKGELDHMLAQLETNSAVRKYEVKMRKRTAALHLEISISLMRDGANRTLGSVCVARDLSPLKKAFEQLQKEVAGRKGWKMSCANPNGAFGTHLKTKKKVEEILGRNWFETFLPLMSSGTLSGHLYQRNGEGEIPIAF